MAVETWLRNRGYGIQAAESWLQDPGSESWLQTLGWGIVAVESWLWNPGCGIMAVEPSRQHLQASWSHLKPWRHLEAKTVKSHYVL